jgi:hypothetical protein
VFNRLRYEIAVRRLQREMRQTQQFYTAKSAEALKNKLGAMEMQKLNEEEIFEVQVIHDKIARLQTTYLREEAERYLVPVPPFNHEKDGDWEFAATAAHYQLKMGPLAELRSAIRKEKKERREAWQSWAALLIGLIGAMIGLVAAFKK